MWRAEILPLDRGPALPRASGRWGTAGSPRSVERNDPRERPSLENLTAPSTITLRDSAGWSIIPSQPPFGKRRRDSPPGSDFGNGRCRAERSGPRLCCGAERQMKRRIGLLANPGPLLLGVGVAGWLVVSGSNPRQAPAFE